MKQKTLTYRRSRWYYAWAYFLIVLSLFFSIFFYDKGYNTISYVLTVFGLILLVIFEFLIRLKKIVLTRDSVKLREGILSKSVVNAHYSDISDVGVQQSFLQRILNFGDVGVNTPGMEDVEIILRSAVRPNKIHDLIEKQIQRHRTKVRHGKSVSGTTAKEN